MKSKLHGKLQFTGISNVQLGQKAAPLWLVRSPRTPFRIFKTKMISIFHTYIANCTFNLYCYKSIGVRKESTRGKLVNK